MAKNLVKPILPVINRAHPLTKGLVACYPFFEKGGTTLRDISGKNRNGTLTDMEIGLDWVKTPRGYGLDFITDDYVNISNANNFLPLGNSPRTIMGWAKVPTQTRGTFFGYGGGASGNAFYLEIFIDHLYFVGYGQDVTGVKNIIDGVFHQIVVTYNGTTVKLYVDGMFDASGDKILNTTSTAFLIGRQGFPDGVNYEYLNGVQTEVLFWDRALSAREIATLYADPCGLYVRREVMKYVPVSWIGKVPVAPSGGEMRMGKYWGM